MKISKELQSCLRPGYDIGMVLDLFLQCFNSPPFMGRLLTVFTFLKCFFLKYLDYYLIDKPALYDGASGFYMGKYATTVHHLMRRSMVYSRTRYNYAVLIKH